MLIVNDREPGSDAARAALRRLPLRPLSRRGRSWARATWTGAATPERPSSAWRCWSTTRARCPCRAISRPRTACSMARDGYECGGYNRGPGLGHVGLRRALSLHARPRLAGARGARLVKACDWVTHERRRTMVPRRRMGRRPIDYGFLPAGSLEDVTDYWHWLSSNAYACLGFTRPSPGPWPTSTTREAPRLQAEAEAFRQRPDGRVQRVARPLARGQAGRWQLRALLSAAPGAARARLRLAARGAGGQPWACW